jgi:hypothetical protein
MNEKLFLDETLAQQHENGMKRDAWEGDSSFRWGGGVGGCKGDWKQGRLEVAATQTKPACAGYRKEPAQASFRTPPTGRTFV